MSVRLSPGDRIGGQPAMRLAEILAWNSAWRPDMGGPHQCLYVRGRGGETATPQEERAMFAAGLIEADAQGQVWITPEGNGLKHARLAPRVPRPEAEAAWRLVEARLQDPPLEGAQPWDAWLFGSLVNGTGMVGDIDLQVNLRRLDPSLDGMAARQAWTDHLTRGIAHGLAEGITVRPGNEDRPAFACIQVLAGGKPCRIPCPEMPERFERDRIAISRHPRLDPPEMEDGWIEVAFNDSDPGCPDLPDERQERWVRESTTLPLSVILDELVNPLEMPPWPVRDESWKEWSAERILAMARRGKTGRGWDHGMDRRSAHDHMERVAWLMMNPADDPITIAASVGQRDWPIADGNHRLCAAILSGDRDIRAEIFGDPEVVAALRARLLDESGLEP